MAHDRCHGVVDLVRPPRRWAPPTALLWALTLFSLLALGMLMPVIPYHEQCRSLYEERLRHSREPQVTPEWAASIRNWAEIDGCSTCNSTGRISLFFYLRENRWNLTASRRAGQAEPPADSDVCPLCENGNRVMWVHYRSYKGERPW